NHGVPSKNNFDGRRARPVIRTSSQRNRSHPLPDNSDKKWQRVSAPPEASWRKPAPPSAPFLPSRIDRHRAEARPRYATFPSVGPRNESRACKRAIFPVIKWEARPPRERPPRQRRETQWPV